MRPPFSNKFRGVNTARYCLWNPFHPQRLNRTPIPFSSSQTPDPNSNSTLPSYLTTGSPTPISWPSSAFGLSGRPLRRPSNGPRPRTDPAITAGRVPEMDKADAHRPSDPVVILILPPAVTPVEVPPRPGTPLRVLLQTCRASTEMMAVIPRSLISSRRTQFGLSALWIAATFLRNGLEE
jgi:hypothetical protein